MRDIDEDPLDGETDPLVLYVAQYSHDRSEHNKDMNSPLGVDWLCNCISKARQAVAAMKEFDLRDRVSRMTMEFVSIKSNGGPFDDESYRSGVACGSIDAKLDIAKELDATEVTKTVRRSELPQLNLIAARHRFFMHVEPDEVEPENWCTVRFTTTLP